MVHMLCMMVLETGTSPADWELEVDLGVITTLIALMEKRRKAEAAAHGQSGRTPGAPGAGGPMQFSG